MKSMKLISLSICVCLAIYVDLIKCNEDDSLLQYDGEISMSNTDDANKEIYEDEISDLPYSGLILEHEMIYEQSDQPVSGERFIAVRVNKMGAAENLKPNLVGLSNMAIQFLPKDYKFVEVIEATREIVSGVRYELLIAAHNENDDNDVICRLVVTEITWKLTAWGDKQRVLDYSNCTSNATSEDDVPKSNDFNFNPLFVTKTNFINEDDLKLIEAQIIKPKNTENIASKPKYDEMSDFNLGNLEAMIIPSIAKPFNVQADVNMDTVMENLFQINTPKVSQFQNVIEPTQETQTIKSESLTETQLKSESIVTNFATEKTDQKSHEIVSQTFVSKEPQISTERDFIGAVNDTKNLNQENTLNEPHLEDITTQTEELNKASSEPSILTDVLESPKPENERQIPGQHKHFKNESEITSETIISPTAEVTKTQSTENLINEPEKYVTGIHENYEKAQQLSDFTKNKDEQFQPRIEDVALQMEDSIVNSTQKTIVIFDKMNDDEKAINEYTAELYKNAESASNSPSNDRAKREIDTEMIFFEHLTNQALEQLDYVDSDNLKRVALEILRVKKIEQDNGAIHVIKVKTANSKCPEESPALDESCLRDVIEGTTKMCFIEVKSKRDVNKVTKSECFPEREKREIAEPARIKRQQQNRGLGAPVDTDPEESQQIEQLVREALIEVNGNPDKPSYGLQRIKSSTKQVVAGILYKVDAEFVLPDNEVKDCRIEFVVKAWIKPEPTVLKFDCGQEDEVTRKKRSLFYDPRMDRVVTEYDKNVTHMFDRFKSEFNRKYESAMEHDMRLRIFKNNLYVIDELNRNEQGTATYGITEFTDYTLHEYKQRTGLLRRKEDQNEISHPIAKIPNIDLPKSFDWREKGVVTEVKNQGSCGSCWAFSVTGNIEGLHAIKTGKLEEYSEQELVDCDTIDSGCNGGLPDNAYKAIEQLGGLELESEYPYSAKKSTCNFNSTLTRVQVSGAVDLPQNETAMAQYLVQNGPLSIGINANAMQFYRGGISKPLRILCRHSGIDHGVLIVGYGVSEYPVFNKTLPYWIVKNSWGPTWGEQGYYRVFRGDNTCGLTSMVTSAVLG